MARKLMVHLCLPVWLILLLSSAVMAGDWKMDWVTMRGFTVDIDTEGYDFPSAIAVVPNPGPGPKDPLYFVTELRGKVKVVTNDRSIYTFADNFFQLVPKEEIPNTYGEVGLAAIALDPTHGYIFVSFAYQDERKILHNNIVRFSSQPTVFGLKATGALSFGDIFKADTTSTHHQVGGMVIEGSTLFVSVGDGYQPTRAQDVDTTSGKILRMTLDGKPLHDNPYYENDDVSNAKNFVWAVGLRNPFGLAYANGRLFSADNGIDIDRFLEVRRGENYKWDGTDWSIGMNAAMVFSPAVAPVQLTWLPKDSSVFPSEYRAKFFVAFAGARGPTRGVVTLDYNFARSQIGSRPTQFLRYEGENNHQMPVGVAFGVEGLYVVPILPVKDEQGAKGVVLQIRHKAESKAENLPKGLETTQAIMWRASCVHCHSFNAADTTLQGPPLDDETLIPRILKRLSSREYQESLREIEALKVEPYVSYRKARQEVMGATDIEKARLWIKYRIMDPRFDRLAPVMPVLGLNEMEAEKIADYLVSRYGTGGNTERVKHFLDRFLPGEPKRKHIAIAFVAGMMSACGAYLGLLLIRRVRGRSVKPDQLNKPTRGRMNVMGFTPNPMLYILILSCGLLVPFGFQLRQQGVFGCPSDGYGDKYYLAYCHGDRYGDYDHSAFWFGLEPGIESFAADADVLFLGNSRLQFGFSSQATREWFSSSTDHYYLLGFSSDENMTFTTPILSKIQPRAKVYIINVDRFFEDRETGIGKEILRDKDAQRRAIEKRFWQAIHKPICTTLSIFCGTNTSFFRLRETGEWKLSGSRRWTTAPVTIGPPSDRELWNRYAVLGEQFVSHLPVDRHCVLLTIVPYQGTRLTEATAIASTLGLDLLTPQLDGLQTFDGSHLDRPSAERWSQAFFQMAGPRIRECLGKSPRAS